MDVIQHFAGKVPIFGVCLGHQAIIEVFGGVVAHAGEIVHGKATAIEHDGKGVFHGIKQNVKVTRYHSLAGKDIPTCLNVSAKTESGIVQGVRHQEFTTEGVQFHPESIVCENGMEMIANFLKVKGGKWSDYESNVELFQGQSYNAGTPSILAKIVERKHATVEALKASHATSLNNLKAYISSSVGPKTPGCKEIVKKLKSQRMSVFAEYKRASPSKGVINADVYPVVQAKRYSNGSATVISVLTEEHSFLGSIFDMQMIRQSLETGTSDRPYVLRKDFIFDEYQVYESRVFGADMILLIVAILTPQKLKDLIICTRSLDMEPLVEVNNEQEMKIALESGAKVIGINNRNLHTFEVDMETTTRLVGTAPKDVSIIALSGVKSREDVLKYEQIGVVGVLVGESLMKSDNPFMLIKSFLGKE